MYYNESTNEMNEGTIISTKSATPAATAIVTDDTNTTVTTNNKNDTSQLHAEQQEQERLLTYNSFDDEYGDIDTNNNNLIGNTCIEYENDTNDNDFNRKYQQHKENENRSSIDNATTRTTTIQSNRQQHHQQQQQQQVHYERIPSKIPLPIGIETYNMFWMNSENVYTNNTSSITTTETTTTGSTISISSSHNNKTTTSAIPSTTSTVSAAASTTTITTNPKSKGKKKWRYQREYKSHLLHKAQLEICVNKNNTTTIMNDVYDTNLVTTTTNTKNNDSKLKQTNGHYSSSNKNTTSDTITTTTKATTTTLSKYHHQQQQQQRKRRRHVLFQEICKLPPTINPSWRHINECTNIINTDTNTNIITTDSTYHTISTVDTVPSISYEKLSNDEYKTITARISILTDEYQENYDDNNITIGNTNVKAVGINDNSNNNESTTTATLTNVDSNQVEGIMNNDENKNINSSSDIDDTFLNGTDNQVQQIPVLRQSGSVVPLEVVPGQVPTRNRYDSYDFFYNDTTENVNNDTSRNFDDPIMLFQQSLNFSEQQRKEQQQQQKQQSLSTLPDNNHKNHTFHTTKINNIVSTTNSTGEVVGCNRYVVIDVSIHPSKLIRIASIPPNLPLNCIVVYFSDGSIRVQPIHYQLLYESNQYGVVVADNTLVSSSLPSPSILDSKKSIPPVTPPVLSQQSSFDAINSNYKITTSSSCCADDASTNTTVINFDDDAFAELDKVTTKNTTTTTSNIGSSNYKNNNTTTNQKKLSDNNSSISDDLFPDVLASGIDIQNHDTNYLSSNRKRNDNDEDDHEFPNNETELYCSYDTDHTPIISYQTNEADGDNSIINYDIVDESKLNNENKYLYKQKNINETVDLENTINYTVPNQLSDKLKQDTADISDIDVSIQIRDEKELLLERKRLQTLLLAEEASLKVDICQLKSKLHQVQCVQQSIDQLEEQVRVVQDEVRMEHTVRQQYEFLTDSQRIRLISDVAIIYNINIVTADRKYYIRGIEIPHIDSYGTGGSGSAGVVVGNNNNSSTTNVSDDDLSAALGYLCHAVSLLSMYLNVHLRYKLLYYPSRSYVVDIHVVPTSSVRFAASAMASASLSQDMIKHFSKSNNYYSDGQYYPLFYGRGIVSEQCEYAIYLLNCDIDSICRSRNIRTAANSHILAKVKRIYEYVVDGY